MEKKYINFVTQSLLISYVFLLTYEIFINDRVIDKFFLLFQIILIIYFFYIKSYLKIFLILIILFSLEKFLILKNFIVLEKIHTTEKIFKGQSPISYLYVDKKKGYNCYNFKDKQYKNIIPLSNIPNQKIYKGIYNNKIVINKSDEYGFFNNNKIFEANIVFFGDSFLDSSEIKLDKNFVNLLKQEHNIYNFGISQTGPLSQFAILKEYLNIYSLKKISKVFWFYSEENDIARPYINFQDKGGDIDIEFSLTMLKKYFEDKSYKQNLIQYSNCLNDLKNDINNFQITEQIQYYESNLLENFFLKPLSKFIFKNIKKLKINEINSELIRKIDNNEQYELNLERYFKIIGLSKNYLNQKNIDLSVVILPNKFNCKINKRHFLTNIIKKKLNKMNVKYIDLNNIFFTKGKCNKNLFNSLGHFSDNGHKLIYTYLNKKL